MNDVQENIGKILKTQNCKKLIESKLTNKKFGILQSKDFIELDAMLFQVVKQNTLTDHSYFFPCKFVISQQAKIDGSSIKQIQAPKTGSFIRTIKMDFDMKNYQLVIYDYQYLGGQGSIVPTNCSKINWNIESISQVVRKNNTVKGGQILLDSFINQKGPNQHFQMPKIKFLTVRLLQQVLCKPKQQQISVNIPRKITSIVQKCQNEQNMDKEKIVQQLSQKINEEF